MGEKGQRKIREYYWDYKGVITHLYETDIYYVHLENRNLYVYTRDHSYPIGRKIDEEEAHLADMPIVRPHYSYIVNIQQMEAVIGKYIILRNGTFVPLSKNRRKQVKTRIREYIRDR